MQETSNCQWRQVVGYEGAYEVSSLGEVRRSDGYHPSKRLLKPALNHHGYLNVSLSRNGAGRTFFVHRLVCAAFIGPRPERMTINHKNGIKADNRLENLEYVSHQENMRHALHVIDSIFPTRASSSRNGSITEPERLSRGVDVATAKLDDEKVRTVRALLGQGLMQRDIARQVGISQTQMWRIKVGLSWAHVV